MGNILDLSQVWRYAADKTSVQRSTSGMKPTNSTGGINGVLGAQGAARQGNYSESSTGTGASAGSASQKQERTDAGRAADRGSGSGGVDAGGDTKPGDPAGGGGKEPPPTGGTGGNPPGTGGSRGEIPI